MLARGVATRLSLFFVITEARRAAAPAASSSSPVQPQSGPAGPSAASAGALTTTIAAPTPQPSSSSFSFLRRFFGRSSAPPPAPVPPPPAPSPSPAADSSAPGQAGPLIEGGSSSYAAEYLLFPRLLVVSPGYIVILHAVDDGASDSIAALSATLETVRASYKDASEVSRAISAFSSVKAVPLLQPSARWLALLLRPFGSRRESRPSTR